MSDKQSKNKATDVAVSAKLLPLRLDPQHYADKGRELVGQIKSTNMLRLQQMVVKTPSMVHATLRFSRGPYGYPMLSGKIQHSLVLRCERCLDELKLCIDRELEINLKPENESLPEGSTASEKQQTTSKLLDTEVEHAQNVEFYDYDGKSLVLAEVVEEELLLALPQIPKHKDISLCDQDMVAWLAANEVPEQKRPNPFAILKR